MTCGALQRPEPRRPLLRACHVFQYIRVEDLSTTESCWHYITLMYLYHRRITNRLFALGQILKAATLHKRSLPTLALCSFSPASLAMAALIITSNKQKQTYLRPSNQTPQFFAQNRLLYPTCGEATRCVSIDNLV